MMPVRAMQTTRRGTKRGLKVKTDGKRSKKSKSFNEDANSSQELDLNAPNVHINQLPSHVLVR